GILRHAEKSRRNPPTCLAPSLGRPLIATTDGPIRDTPRRRVKSAMKRWRAAERERRREWKRKRKGKRSAKTTGKFLASPAPTVKVSSNPNFTHSPAKLLIFLHTAPLCSHNISLISILTSTWIPEFCESTETKSTLKHPRPILGNRSDDCSQCSIG